MRTARPPHGYEPTRDAAMSAFAMAEGVKLRNSSKTGRKIEARAALEFVAMCHNRL